MVAKRRKKHKIFKRKIKSSARKKKPDLLITSNGRTWLFWDINNPREKSAMKGAAAKAFAMQFPIERVATLAKLAFRKFKVKQVHLWAASGVVGQPFVDLKAFIDWVDEKWSAGRYVNDRGYSSDPERWINGIAILIKEQGPSTPLKVHPITKRKISEMG